MFDWNFISMGWHFIYNGLSTQICVREQLKSTNIVRTNKCLTKKIMLSNFGWNTYKFVLSDEAEWIDVCQGAFGVHPYL